MRLILILIFSLWMIPSALTQAETIRIMSFNIRLPNPDDGIHYWEHRQDLVYGLIRFHKVDLLGVQEAHRSQLEDITHHLPEYAWFGVCRTDGSLSPNPDNEFSAILYRKDRFELIEGNTFWLSETPDQPGSKSWDAALPRIVTWAKLKDKITGQTFIHFNTHFDHMGEVARGESAKLLMHKIPGIAGLLPVVVTGDFNCTERDYAFRVITDASHPVILHDALSVSRTPHYGPMNSFASNFQVSGLKGNRIDFIFVNDKVDVLKHAILSDSWQGRLASDHLPVMAEIMITN